MSRASRRPRTRSAMHCGSWSSSCWRSPRPPRSGPCSPAEGRPWPTRSPSRRWRSASRRSSSCWCSRSGGSRFADGGRLGRPSVMSMITEPVVGPDGAERDETALERCDRNLVELLQEVRVVQTGVQVLFAFLLTAPLAPRFPHLSHFQQLVYFATLLSAGGAAILLIAPTAYHRILFRLGDKEHLVVVANWFTLAGLTGVGLSIVGALLLVSDLLFHDTGMIVLTAGLGGLACLVFWCVAP